MRLPFRYRDDDSSTGTAIAGVLLGAIAGFAVGMFVAQRVGGFSGLAARIKTARSKAAAGSGEERFAESYDEIEEETDDTDDVAEDADVVEDEDVDVQASDGVPLLEERVLEAFNNDPILAERAIDIGAIGSGIIELAGWVEDEGEAEHAMTIAHGVPGVDTVVNRLMMDETERQLRDARTARDDDPTIPGGRWEGQQVGTGKRRQGTSGDLDRHADPKPVLEERWLGEEEAVLNAADDLDDIKAERRSGKRKVRPLRADEATPGE